MKAESWTLYVQGMSTSFGSFGSLTRMMMMISGDWGGGDRWRRLRLRRKCRNCSYTTRLSRLHATGCYSRWKLTTTNCQLHFWPKQYICANSYTCRFSFKMNRGNIQNHDVIQQWPFSSQSLELGRAHKKASSIVNATIDPDKVILISLNLLNNLAFQDIYAIPSRDMANSNSNQRLIYFLSIVDVLTHYGVKKAAAKVTEPRCTKYRASN